MRYAFAIAALAAGALAVPYAENKRGIEYAYEVEVVTNVVTVTAYGTAPTPPPKAKAPHYGHPAPKPKPEPKPAPAPYIPPVAPAYSAPAADIGSSPTDYKSAVVYAHNLHRANHSAPALEWDDHLEECARIVAESCNYAHNTQAGGGGYGQNIAAGVEKNNITAIISDMFYNGEEPLYAGFYGQEPDMSNFEAWGHFSQIVWKSTTHVACYTSNCEASGLGGTGGGVAPYFTVCNYRSPGNYAGQYSANVLAPKGQETADWSASSY